MKKQYRIVSIFLVLLVIVSCVKDPDIPTDKLFNTVSSDTVGNEPVTPEVIEFSYLRLNELNGNDKFIEIYNAGPSAIPMTDVTLYKDTEKLIWIGDSTVTIPAQGYLLLYSEDVTYEGGPQAGYPESLTFRSGLSARKNIRIQLFNPSGESIDDFNLVNIDLNGEYYGYESNQAPASYSRNSDGYWYHSDATPGEANVDGINPVLGLEGGVEPPSPSPSAGVSGGFSISESQQVFFSQGNLQYQASTNTWRFAEKQWDYVGEENSNVSSTYDGWIDLFGWGTSGYNGKSPFMTSTEYSDYGIGSSNIAGTNYDWGVYNAISNGDNTANMWRTLTWGEWVYVLNVRSTASGIRYTKACVNNVNGVILLPDDWNTSTYSLYSTNIPEADFTTNTITATQWTKLEEAGAVFLPAGGYRYGISVFGHGFYGHYWSASCVSSYEEASSVSFSSSDFYPDYDYLRSDGFSVRLVRSAQ